MTSAKPQTMAPHTDGSIRARMHVWRAKLMVAWGGVQRHPHVVVLPLMATLLVMGLGLWAVEKSAADAAKASREGVFQDILAVANTIRQGFSAAVAPTTDLAITIKNQPEYNGLMRLWNGLAVDLWALAPPGSSMLRMTPQGRVAAVYPLIEDNLESIGLDVLQEGTINKDFHLAILANRNATTTGPYIQDKSQPPQIYVRVPVFVPNTTANETWGIPWNATACPLELCWIPETRSKFWGFASMMLDWDQFLNFTGGPLHHLEVADVEYQLLRPPDVLNETGLQLVQKSANGNVRPDTAVETEVLVLGRTWYLTAWRETWVPGYRTPLIIVVVFASLGCGCLLFVILFTRVQHAALLRSLLPQAAIDRALNNWRWSSEEEDDGKLNLLMQGTPAEAILAMVRDVLSGELPALAHVALVRSALKAGTDIYRPLNDDLRYRMEAHEQMDSEVRAALMAQLLGRQTTPAVDDVAMDSGDEPMEEALDQVKALPTENPENPPLPLVTATLATPEERSSNKSDNMADDEYLSLEGVLCALTGLAPSHQHIDAPTDLIGAVMPHAAPAAQQRFSVKVLRKSIERFSSNVRRTSMPKLSQQGLTRMKPSSLEMSGSSPSTGTRFGKCSSSGAALEGPAPAPAPASLHRALLEDPSRSGQPALMYSAAKRSPALSENGAPAKPLYFNLETVLHTAHQWTFDVFALDEASNGRPLSSLGFWLFYQSGLIEQLHLHPTRLARFLIAVEDGYLDNPYHNRRHAADVLQTVHVLLYRGGLVPGYADDKTLLGCYLAAIIHDFEHLGRNNDFLVNTQHELAVLYNDRSPMENHHLAAAWSLLRKKEFNFISKLTKNNWVKLRKLVVDLVLATDMKQHFGLVGQFSALHRLADSSNDNGPVVPGSLVSETDMSSVGTHSSGTNSPHASTGEEAYTPMSEADQLLSLQMAIKVADVGHLTAQRPVHLKWVAALEEEFFLQGDAERALGLPISPLCDRTKQGVMKSQVGFIEFVIIPLYTNYMHRFAKARPLYKLMKANYRYWQAQAQAAHQDGHGSRPVLHNSK